MQIKHSKYNLYFNRNHWKFQVKLENTTDGWDMRFWKEQFLAYFAVLYQNKTSKWWLQRRENSASIQLAAWLTFWI
jgi:hypothetical protein